MKRLFDCTVALAGLIVLSPLLAVLAVAVWWHDFRSPLYVSTRVGLHGRHFGMVKLRSMRAGADRTGVDSTSAHDSRITPVGRLLRAYKLDELLQLWNVLKGEMSLVGPRPQVLREVAIYTDVERGLFNARPGITDFASIIFSDEADVLAGTEDPDLAYNQLIRPWKSRLGLLYVQRRSLRLDVELMVLTAVAQFSRPAALTRVHHLLETIGAGADLCRVALRDRPLRPAPPPGANAVVTAR